MDDRWKPVDGWPYDIDREGTVRRTVARKGTRVGKILRPQLSKVGYWTVSLSRDGVPVRHYVHRLLAAAFIGPCPRNCEVNHRNGIKADNRLTNLEYVSHRQNSIHAVVAGLQPTGENHHRAKLNWDKVREIRRRCVDGERPVDLAIVFGVSEATIRKVRDRIRW